MCLLVIDNIRFLDASMWFGIATVIQATNGCFIVVDRDMPRFIDIDFHQIFIRIIFFVRDAWAWCANESATESGNTNASVFFFLPPSLDGRCHSHQVSYQSRTIFSTNRESINDASFFIYEFSTMRNRIKYETEWKMRWRKADISIIFSSRFRFRSLARTEYDKSQTKIWKTKIRNAKNLEEKSWRFYWWQQFSSRSSKLSENLIFRNDFRKIYMIMLCSRQFRQRHQLFSHFWHIFFFSSLSPSLTLYLYPSPGSCSGISF